MSALFSDVFDLYRFRVKPLATYRHPLWQVLLLLCGVGLVLSAGSPELGGYLPGRIGFGIAYNLLETLLFTVFIGLWLGLGRQAFSRALFSLVTLASAIQLLQPLTDWLPDDVGSVVLLLLLLYSLVVLCHALYRISGLRLIRVLVGVLLFALLSSFLLQGCWYLAGRAGVVSPPAGGWNPFATISQPPASSASGPSPLSADSGSRDQNGDGNDNGDQEWPLP